MLYVETYQTCRIHWTPGDTKSWPKGSDPVDYSILKFTPEFLLLSVFLFQPCPYFLGVGIMNLVYTLPVALEIILLLRGHLIGNGLQLGVKSWEVDIDDSVLICFAPAGFQWVETIEFGLVELIILIQHFFDVELPLVNSICCCVVE